MTAVLALDLLETRLRDLLAGLTREAGRAQEAGRQEYAEGVKHAVQALHRDLFGAADEGVDA